MSRLGRASEGKFFADRQAQQAAAARAALSKEQLVALRRRSKNASARSSKTSVDIVAAIAGHSVYERLALSNARAAMEAEYNYPAATTLSARLNDPNPSNLAASKLQVRGGATGMASMQPDAGVLRAMGQNRFAIYHDVRRHQASARSLPGAQVRGEGALIGVQAFIISTAFVGSIGMAGIIYLYTTPSAVEGMKVSSVRFRERLEAGPIGHRIRKTVASYREDGGIVSEEAQEQARAFARHAVKKRDQQTSLNLGTTNREPSST